MYSDLIALARARRVPAFLDTYGPALEAIWGFWPDAIQLNRREAGAHLRMHPQDLDDAQVFGLLDSWARHGVKSALVTDGPRPALALAHGRRVSTDSPGHRRGQPDRLGRLRLAGTVDAWLAGSDPERMLRHALGCALANVMVWDAGAIDLQEVRRQEEAVGVEALGR